MDNIICAYRIDSDFFDAMSSIPEVTIEPPLANGSIAGSMYIFSPPPAIMHIVVFRVRCGDAGTSD